MEYLRYYSSIPHTYKTISCPTDLQIVLNIGCESHDPNVFLETYGYGSIEKRSIEKRVFQIKLFQFDQKDMYERIGVDRIDITI